MSVPAPKFAEHLALSKNLNQPLWPLSDSGFGEWKDRSESDIRSALRAKVLVGKEGRETLDSSDGTTLGGMSERYP